MIRRIDHIGVAVCNLEETKKRLQAQLGATFIAEKDNPENRYRVAIFQIGENTFSFMQSTSPEGFVAKHIERYGEGPQHIGLEVNNLDQFVEHFRDSGLKAASGPEVAGVRREVLVGPQNPLGIILQVVEWLGEYKDASPQERMKKVWG
jgi:methylmalonyl-CoA/ethylmalonyl-CoA epimerase